MINIIASYYYPHDKERVNELEYALEQNCRNTYVERIHLFVDDDESLCRLNEFINLKKEIDNNVEKIKIIGIKKAYYSDLFNYADTLDNKICLILNNDIYLKSIRDEKIFDLLDSNSVFALTRYEYDLSCPLIDNYEGSHDGFMFRSPLKNGEIFLKKNIIRMFLDLKIGKDTKKENIIKYKECIEEISKTCLFYQFHLGSENVVISLLYFMGYRISNPCGDIILVHQHKKKLFDSRSKYVEEGIRINNYKYLVKIEPTLFMEDHKVFCRKC